MTKFLRYLAKVWLCAVACCIVGFPICGILIEAYVRGFIGFVLFIFITGWAAVFVAGGGEDND